MTIDVVGVELWMHRPKWKGQQERTSLQVALKISKRVEKLMVVRIGCRVPCVLFGKRNEREMKDVHNNRINFIYKAICQKESEDL